MYLLGDFDVQLAGAQGWITKPVRMLGFGSVCGQGLPFYGGNLSYEMEIDVPECQFVQISTTHYRGMFVKVFADGVEQGDILFAPYRLNVKLSPGKHRITFRLYGNRHNSFGALHNADDSTYYYGPDAWRTQGDSWAYEYRVRDYGVLKSPIFTFIK